MAIEVTVKKVEPMTVAFIPMKGPFNLISEAFGKLDAWIGEKGYVPSGPPAGIYFNDPGEVPAEELLWELQSPIAGDIAPSSPDQRGVGVKKLDETEVASALYKGPYEGMGNVYGELVGWIMGNGYEIAGAPSEVYVSDPGETPPEELLTEVRFPVMKK